MLLRTSCQLRGVNTIMIRAMMTGGSDLPRFRAFPSPALVDDITEFQIENLQPKQKVTAVAVLKEGFGTFISHAHYQADSNGFVDFTNQPSAGGSYTGIEPMGLMWAMKPEEGSRKGLRLAKKDATTPFQYELYAIADYCSVLRADSVADTALCSLQHPRSYMAPGVKRIPVKTGRIRGCLFLPAGAGPFPGVIDLFGTAGGLMEFRSALLASRGFASLALAYFGYDDLSPMMKWDMEMFEEAVDWMAAHDSICKGRLGTIGVSKGTELAMYMALYSDLVKAVVAIGPYHYYSYAEHTKDGRPVETTWPDWESLLQEDEGLVIEESYWKTIVKEHTEISVELVKSAEYLFINGGDDRCTSPKHTDIMIDRLKKHGKSNYQRLRYPGAGHLLEPPYTPLARTAYHKVVGTELLFGGYPKEHAIAQEDSWRQILAFFRKHVKDDQNTQQSSRFYVSKL